jgi:hypothetical protein
VKNDAFKQPLEIQDNGNSLCTGWHFPYGKIQVASCRFGPLVYWFLLSNEQGNETTIIFYQL